MSATTTWHVELAHREWVVWWYNQRTDGNGHVSPATRAIKISGKSAIMPFQLPRRADIGGRENPVIVRRVTSWAWRFTRNDLAVTTDWHLADSVEDCKQAAVDWVDHAESLYKSDRTLWKRYAADVRDLAVQ